MGVVYELIMFLIVAIFFIGSLSSAAEKKLLLTGICLLIASGLIWWDIAAHNIYKSRESSHEIIIRPILHNAECNIMYYVGADNKLVTLVGEETLFNREITVVKIDILKPGWCCGRYSFGRVTKEFVQK